MSKLEERVRERIRHEMTEKHLSQRDLAVSTGWSQPQLSKMLAGRVIMGVADMETLCFAVGLSPVEAVRDHGLEFVAEMTPTELRTLERIRQLPEPDRQAYLHLLDVRLLVGPQRYAGKKPPTGPRLGKPRRKR